MSPRDVLVGAIGLVGYGALGLLVLGLLAALVKVAIWGLR